MQLMTASNLLGAFAVFSKTHMPVHFCQAYLEVCLADEANEPCTFRRLEEALDLTNSSVSRTVAALGKAHRRGHDGFDLVDVIRDPEQGRRFLIRLTPKGRVFKKVILSV